MSGSNEENEELTDEELVALENDAPAATLLKRSLGEAPPADEAKDKALLLGVQKKLRQRSKGKFYADGWSTSQSRLSYALVAGVMLVVIVLVYLALGPMGVVLR